MVFKDAGEQVEVVFYTVALELVADTLEKQTLEMDIGYISSKYQHIDYFDNFKENMLGLAPMQTSDKDLLNR